MTDAWAVVVARTSGTAKSRLGSVLAASQRAALARAMLLDVLAACQRARLAGCVAVVDDLPGLTLAQQTGALGVLDAGRDMNAAVRLGLERAAPRQPAGVVVLPGDVPLVTPGEIATLLERLDRCHVVVGRDRTGVGTNALALRPPGVLAPAFGPASARRHLARAEAGQLRSCALDLPGLGLDVDTPDDLHLLARERPRGDTGRALTRLGIGTGTGMAQPGAAGTPVR